MGPWYQRFNGVEQRIVCCRIYFELFNKRVFLDFYGVAFRCYFRSMPFSLGCGFQLDFFLGF